jgi:hypothetical protein
MMTRILEATYNTCMPALIVLSLLASGTVGSYVGPDDSELGLVLIFEWKYQ